MTELHALTQRFADAFDQRDLMTVMEMLSEDVKVFDHLEGIISVGFGFRQPSCRVYSDTVGIVNAYDMFVGVTKEGKARSIHGRTTLVFIKKAGSGEL